MTLVLETGSGVTGANSYVDVTYADSYFSGHPFYADAWAEVAETFEKENLLKYASRQLDTMFVWVGDRFSTTQGLDWPRNNAYDYYGVLIPYNSVPERIKQATCEMAYWATKGDQTVLTDSETQGITKLKVDVIELDFSSSTIRRTVVPTAVQSLLRGYGQYACGIRVRKVLVG